MVSWRGARLVYLLLAGACAAAAVGLPRVGALSLSAEQVASQGFSSSLVPKMVPLAALTSTTGDARFQALVGGPVGIEPGPDNSFRLVAKHADPKIAQARVQQSVALLSAELERLALVEVKANREHLKKLETEVSKRLQGKSELKKDSSLAVSLSKKDGQRVLRLQRETAALNNFVAGGARPGWLGPLLDRGSLERQERKLQAAKNELARLSEMWHAGSKPVQAQTKLVQREKAELLSLERHLAGVLLDSHRLELKGLEEKSHSLVQQNREAQERDAALAQATPSALRAESAQWMKEKSAELEAQAAQMEKQAALVPRGAIEIVAAQPMGRWIVGGLWLACLGFLWRALSQPQAPAGRPARAPRPTGAVTLRPEAPMPAAAAPSDELFGAVLTRVERELGRPPRCLLILAVDGAERSSFALRLARTLSNSGRPVKLVDFDFRSQELSQRIHGPTRQPGVSDLLAYGGSAEEFFASFPETRIQFAPAGRVGKLDGYVDDQLVQRLLTHRDPGGMTMVDADFTSPLHLLAANLDAVLLLSLQKHSLSKSQEQVLLALRESRLPIWGVAQGSSGVFPYL